MVVSFSIRKLDTKSLNLVEDIKGISIRNGINFSHIVIEALEKYKEEVLDKKDLK